MRRFLAVSSAVPRLLLARHCSSTVPPTSQQVADHHVAASEVKAPEATDAADALASTGVTPWKVEAPGPRGIDYTIVREQFGSQAVDDGLIETFTAAVNKRRTILAERKATKAAAAAADPSSQESVSAAATTGGDVEPYTPHHLIRRGLAFSHRDLDVISSDLSQGKGIYLYTGRGPSAAAMHVGHLVPFLLTQHLQTALDVPLVVQLTDDEKYLFRDLGMKELEKMTRNNIQDVLALLDRDLWKSRTFIFQNTRYFGQMYPTVLEVQRLFTGNAVMNTFGITATDNVGKLAFPATQAAPCFASAFPNVLPTKSRNLRCLIPCAVDQDPFFRLTRSICDRMKRPKPALLHTKFVPALKGPTHKMSSSAEQNGTILLTDPPNVVKKKLRSAFSGGRGTLEMLQEHGADLEVDVAYQFLRFFEPSDDVVDDVAAKYSSGALSTGAVKDKATAVVVAALSEFQAKRAAVTDADVDAVMAERNILF